MKHLLLSIALTITAAAAAQSQTAPPPNEGAAAATAGTVAALRAPAGEEKREDCGCEADVPADAFAVVNG
ncbi:MAG TPA: hypothetical protein VE713_00865, partial [Pyrinomonadaceae bacterium]|nr:hypothetical protein [Pyrinomonadaceae bacterium]